MDAAAAIARAVAVAGLVVAADQALKQWAATALDRGESVNVFAGLDLTNTRNTGVAFGVLEGGGPLVGILIGISLGALLLFFLFHTGMPGIWLPVGLLVGGALGNLADRARDGAVIDFLDPVLWPAFNLADATIVFGVLAFLYVVEGERERAD
jgi:signal peptidase II